MSSAKWATPAHVAPVEWRNPQLVVVPGPMLPFDDDARGFLTRITRMTAELTVVSAATGALVLLLAFPSALIGNMMAETYVSRGASRGESVADVYEALQGSTALWLQLGSACVVLWGLLRATLSWIPPVTPQTPEARAAVQRRMYRAEAAGGAAILGLYALTGVLPRLTVLFAVLLNVVVVGAPMYVVAELARQLRWPQLTRRTLLTLAAPAVSAFVYNRYIPTLMLSPSTTDAQRLLARLVVHPVLSELTQLPLRHLARSIPAEHVTDMTRELSVLVLTTIDFYGRFMATTLQSWGAVVAVVVGISLEEFALRATQTRRDAWLLGPAPDAARAAQVKADTMLAHEVTEGQSIVVAAGVNILYRLSVDGRTPDVGTVVGSAVLQWGAELLTDLTPMGYALQPRLPMAARVRVNLVNAYNAWAERAPTHARQLALTAFFQAFLVRFMLVPGVAWCPTYSTVYGGVKWWTLTPC